jgi:hypothetical protein
MGLVTAVLCSLNFVFLIIFFSRLQQPFQTVQNKCHKIAL